MKKRIYVCSNCSICHKEFEIKDMNLYKRKRFISYMEKFKADKCYICYKCNCAIENLRFREEKAVDSH